VLFTRLLNDGKTGLGEGEKSTSDRCGGEVMTVGLIMKQAGSTLV
jgi:hypothetical protein